MKRILIAGCGDIGALLGRHYHESGHEVYGIRRRVERLPAYIRPLRADLADPGGLPALPEGIDRVFVTLTADAFTETAYRRTYVEGTRRLIGAIYAQDRRPRRLVFVSSTSVYGQRNGEWVDETSPTKPSHFSGTCMLEAEQAVRDGPVPGIVVRLGGIYGQGRRALLDRVSRGQARLHAGPARYVNLNHIGDVAGSLAHLAGLDDPPPLVIATDGRPPERNELIRWLAARLGLPEPPTEEEPGGGSRRSSSKRCRNDRLVATGYRFSYPDFRAGYAEMLGGRTGPA